MDANVIKYNLQNSYERLYNADIKTDIKNREMADIISGIYQLGNKHALMSTVEQIATGVENPLKEQGKKPGDTLLEFVIKK